ncbi:MAG: hypothetical protein JO256_15785 [Alphaproteobacteria bacterium]|nr:hypothetical protein [Alphaproteobacteria bacterium]
MAESQTVVILRAKRDAIAATIQNYERQLELAKHDFTHITAALAIFEAQDNPDSQRAYVALFNHFKYGEIADLCRALLKGGPRSTTELTKLVMAEKGMDPTDRVLVGSVNFSVLRSLRGLARRKTVTQTRKRGRCIWALA